MAKIIIVDDDKNYRSSLRRLLVDLDYEVIVAENGNEALESLQENPADIVITDIFMPDKDGLELIMELKKKSHTAKIIAISGSITQHNVKMSMLQQAKSLGADSIIKKPFKNEQLLSAIKNILNAE